MNNTFELTSIKREPVKENIENGIWQAKIDTVYGFKSKKDEKLVAIQFSIKDGRYLVNLKKYFQFKLYEGTALYEFLESINMLPELDEDFAFSDIVGLKVRVKVVNNTTDDGRRYSNITEISLTDEEEIDELEDDEITEERKTTFPKKIQKPKPAPRRVLESNEDSPYDNSEELEF